MSLPTHSYLVTGGAGFIGSHLCDFLVSKGHMVYVIDDLSNGSLANLPKHENLEFFDLSILDDLSSISPLSKIDCAFHLAAQVSVQNSIEDPQKTYLINKEGTKNVLNFCKNFKIPKAVLASSAAVYGDAPVPISETQELCPLSPYAKSKIDMENIAHDFSDHSFQTTCLRFFNVFGPRQNPSSSYSGVITKFFNSLKNNSPITVFGDGSQTRDFIYVSDVVSALFCAATNSSRNSSPIYNVGSGTQTSINSLIGQVNSISGTSVPVVYSPARKGDILHSVASISKIKKELGFSPSVSLFSGLKSTWEWFKKND